MEEQFGEISLEYVFVWVEFKIKFRKNKEASAIVEKYLKSNRSSKELWLLSLKAKLDESKGENESEVLDLFKKSVANLKEKETLELWRIVLAWFEANKCKSIEKLFEVINYDNYNL